jgi:hypothetical protein
MAKFKVLVFCSTPKGSLDWQPGDIVELPDDTVVKAHIERVPDAVKKVAAKKVAATANQKSK